MRPLSSLVNKIKTPYVARAEGNNSWRNTFSSDVNRADPKRMMDMMGAASTLFSIVSTNAEAVASVDWKLYRKAASGKDEDRVEVTQHPALVVWNKPNNFYSQYRFVESEQQHVDLTGEGWWVLVKDERAPALGPTEIWPVRPDRMFPIKHPTEFLVGYIYRAPDGEEIPLEVDEVIQICMPNPNDPYRGMGPVQALMATLYGYAAAQEYNRNFFVNGAAPGGIISFPTELEDDEWRRHKRRWDTQHRGVSAAHRVAILEGGATWQDRTYTNNDMQFTELMNFSRDVIREAFGMHKHILGQSDDVNLASALAADTSYSTRRVVPRLERFKGALNFGLLPKYGGRGDLEFDYCNAVPKNADEENKERESKANAFKTLVDAGVNPDDAAQVAGLPPMRSVPKPVMVPDAIPG